MTAGGISSRILATLLLLGALEGGIFHSGLYSLILEPDSTTGSMELLLRNELHRPKANRDQVLAVGHSRMALRPWVANALTPTTGYTFATVALGSTTPRVWYYILRTLDPSAHTYSAIIIPTDDYDEPDTYDIQAERELDLHYLINRLTLMDILHFPWSYSSTKLRWVAARDILLKGFVYKTDFLNLLKHPGARITKVLRYNREFADLQYAYTGPSESLAGLQVDWQHKAILVPSGMSPELRDSISGILFSDHPPDGGRQTAYLRYWYGRILNRYRGSGTMLFFLRVPRAPVPPPSQRPKLASAVRQLASEPNVVLLDEHLFDQLERPDLFVDAMHLNREGMERFTAILVAEVVSHLRPPRR